MSLEFTISETKNGYAVTSDKYDDTNGPHNRSFKTATDSYVFESFLGLKIFIENQMEEHLKKHEYGEANDKKEK